MGQNKSYLKIIPLGGVGEIGMNMTAFECNDRILLVDCGIMFPEDSMFGVDIVIPDFTYLLENRAKVVALVLTHGHEDHIGAVPYLLKEIPIPVYGTRLTMALVESKLEDHNIKGIPTHIIHPDTDLQLDVFSLEFVRVAHSIMDGVAIGIGTPAGFVVHSGDFKLDFDPAQRHTTDIRALAKLGDKEVLCLLSDSTNVEQYGYTMSENEVGNKLNEIFRDAAGRIIITLFASNIARIQQVFNIAEGYGRKICISGRSMIEAVSTARRLGYLNVSDAQLIELKSLSRQSKKRTVILTTGSQGEPMSALSRIAFKQHKHIHIVEGDTVILSSRMIPGNECTITMLINALFQQGAQVVYETIRMIHTSGHAHKEELKLMLKLIRPQYFMPIHGETRHLVQHCRLAKDMGVREENLLCARNGDVILFKDGMGKIAGRIDAGRTFVDGKGVGDVGTIILTDRRLLSENGVVTCTIVYEEKTGKLLREPELCSRGFVYEPDYQELLDALRKESKEAFARIRKEGTLGTQAARESMGRALRRLINKQTLRRPVVMPIFIGL